MAAASLLAFALTLAGALLGQLVFWPVISGVFPVTGSSPWVHLLYLTIGFGPIIILITLYCALRERRNILLDVIADAAPLRHAAVGAVLGSLLVILPVGYGRLAGVLTIETSPWDIPLVLALVAAMSACIVQTFAEELVFRGWLLPTLIPRLGTALAVAVSSAVFAATHLLNSGFSPLNFLSLMLAGAVLGVLTVLTRSIWAASAGHALWNWTQVAGTWYSDAPADAGTTIATVAAVHGPLPGGGNIEAWGVFTVSAASLLLITVALLRRASSPTASLPGQASAARPFDRID